MDGLGEGQTLTRLKLYGAKMLHGCMYTISTCRLVGIENKINKIICTYTTSIHTCYDYRYLFTILPLIM